MTFVPDAIFVPLSPDEAAERVVQLQSVEAPITLYGNLHMLYWPPEEAEQKALVSRCADDLLLRPPDEYSQDRQVYALDAQCRPPAERLDVDWQEVIKRLPRARIAMVIILDAGPGWGFLYEVKSRADSQQQSRMLAHGIASYHRRLR